MRTAWRSGNKGLMEEIRPVQPLSHKEKVLIYLKNTIVDSVVLPAITDGAETCTLTKHQGRMFPAA